MAISSLDMSFEKIPSQSTSSAQSSKHSSRLLQLNGPPESILSSATSKCSRQKYCNGRSPYLTGDRVQLLSRVIEKRFVQKTNIVSSFPLAVNLYKANSDDFKPPKRVPKKIKKSVLTLPNNPAPVPQVCTVSDMNDSEYCKKEYEDRKRKVIKKRGPNQSKRKARVREKDIEYYDRDAKYCSQLNISLDCSSTDMMKSFNGDGNDLQNWKKNISTSSNTQTASNNISDVWAVLRNINSFQFRPSPPMSEDSIVPVKKKVHSKSKRPNRKDARMIETCRTQEFAYISSYELDEKSPHSYSPSSSIDRITVIDNKDKFSQLCEEFEKRLLVTHDLIQDSNNTKSRNHRNKTSKNPKSNVKVTCNVGSKDNKQLPLKKKKKVNPKSLAVEQSNSKITNISTDHKDSLISADTLELTDNLKPAKLALDYDNLGSAKAELPNKMNEQVSRNDKSENVVILNTEHKSTGNIHKGLDPQKRKPRLLTTMPSSCLLTKLTQTEIKRKLTSMRFPIVILGKDEVSSSITVTDYDPPQFNGLDDHIWPFMVEWSATAHKDTKQHNNTQSKKCDLLDYNLESKSRKSNIEDTTHTRVSLKDKKQILDDSTTNKRKTKITPTPYPDIKDKLLECSKKQKSIVQLKDKMLNFLYKRTSNRENYENDESKPITPNKSFPMAENNITALTNKQLNKDNVLVLNDTPIKRVLSSDKKTPLYKHPWAKAKWASDFIDNVMKKVRRGVYYTQDRKDFCHTYQIDLKEASVQAGSQCDSTDFTQTCDSETDSTDDDINNNRNNFISIPGFNNTLPLLEIKTLNMNQIAVKHCVTNILVEFDVTVPTKNNLKMNLNKSSLLLTPIVKTEGDTKVYKCKTTIVNAMLPAELCSILPKMMSSIADSSKTIGGPTLSSSNQSWLSTISEQTRCENGGSSCIIAPIQTSPEIKYILEGRFLTKNYKMSTLHKKHYRMNYDQCLVIDLLPIILLENLLYYTDSPLVMELDNTQYKRSQVSLLQSNKKFSGVTDFQNQNICTSVNVYTGSYKRSTSAFNSQNLVDMIASIMHRTNIPLHRNLCSYLDMLKQFDRKNLQINMSMMNDNGVQKTITVTVNNLNIDSLYKAFPKIKDSNQYEMDTNNSPLKCIEYVNSSRARKLSKTELTPVNIKKIKRNSFYKLYRKCKPVNHESREICVNTGNTPLNKITTLDDFFQILGSKAIFSSVLDGNAEKKILSSVLEMKNWISEINPKQALLILLLNNKKDTHNLVRFRTIILQGIAMNRITRASELDMEIEVIDRENFNKLPQASDYNKPFDESSERLLKSLLQKRKKLNPSYLRVMARYVGLGLVKTPTEY
ncbi:hypothetical protein PYW08_002745 [Mythimna loreyi]|uniref:Uncharacterized protein n=1 Tax=Mythimna loreyi TaxID=667449 RepID=A0ACC2QLF2_9NEOP|nr:hypothetical protein PYW08_002745 [Mythimna loreyi]